MKRIWMSIMETGGARIYSLVVGLVSLSITARILGPEGRGVIAAATAWATLFATFAGLSLGQVAQYRIQGRSKEDWLPNILGTLLPCAAGMALIAYLVVALLFHLTLADGIFKGIPLPLLLIAFAAMPLLIWEEYGSNLLAASGNLRQYNVAQFVGRTVQIAAVALLVAVLGLGASGALSGQLAGQAIVSAGALVALWKAAGGRLRFETGQLKEMLKGSARLHLNTVGSFVLANSTVLMLNSYATKADVGNYQLAFQMIMVLLIIPQAAGMVLYSHMSEVGPDRLWPRQKRLMLQTFVLMSIVGGASYFLAGPAISLLAGPRFEKAVNVFRLLLPNVIGLTFAQLMTCQWIGRGIFLLNTMLTSTMAFVTIIANTILIPRFGLVGAIWAGWASYVGLVVLSQGCFAWWCECRHRQFEARESESAQRALMASSQENADALLSKAL
jgi:O-antigen/teichoic acid export membrane protein